MNRMTKTITAVLMTLAAGTFTIQTANAAGGFGMASVGPGGPGGNTPGAGNNPGGGSSTHGGNTPGRGSNDRGDREIIRKVNRCKTASDCNAMEGKVCFFSLPNFQGKRFCTEPKGRMSNLGSSWNDRISSVAVSNARTKICTDKGLGGDCILINTSRSHLNSLDNAISSVLVR
ncbi:peptidase inhibitor family I36 protein [Rhizobium sp. L1K21]|uniref:peptidase inhibitor family I36 protein n=1 Tax=Rhizobium sp. L1K21 TaxID=2954933 RepID=UPI0020936ADA|nr:peptidase inhibitor family I36 protein [Rhizobium sp. L1K21]MCO6185006.1 peptidase inhibitor family I36 protein [Rhizobium sp. L1K21]